MLFLILTSALLLPACNTTDFAPLLGASYRREKFVESHPSLDARTREAVLNGKVYVGMSAASAEASWGAPSKINRTLTAQGIREQWVYRGFSGQYIRTSSNYLYFKNDVLVAIQN